MSSRPTAVYIRLWNSAVSYLSQRCFGQIFLRFFFLALQFLNSCEDFFFCPNIIFSEILAQRSLAQMSLSQISSAQRYSDPKVFVPKMKQPGILYVSKLILYQFWLLSSAATLETWKLWLWENDLDCAWKPWHASYKCHSRFFFSTFHIKPNNIWTLSVEFRGIKNVV